MNHWRTACMMIEKALGKGGDRKRRSILRTHDTAVLEAAREAYRDVAARKAAESISRGQLREDADTSECLCLIERLQYGQRLSALLCEAEDRGVIATSDAGPGVLAAWAASVAFDTMELGNSLSFPELLSQALQFQPDQDFDKLDHS